MSEAGDAEAVAVGRVLRGLRVSAGLSERELAALLCVRAREVEAGAAALQAWEAGRAPAPVHVLALIARILDVPLHALAHDLLRAVEEGASPAPWWARPGEGRGGTGDRRTRAFHRTLRDHGAGRLDTEEAYQRVSLALVAGV